MSDVTVITATMPDRHELLREAMDSVVAQTLQPQDHLIGVDYKQVGGYRVRNILAAAVNTEWLHVLDDDDVLYPEHLEKLMAVSQDADVVYSWCDVEGDKAFDIYNIPFSENWLRKASIVSHNALIRTDLVLDVGGWYQEPKYDWRFWVRALDAGARFVCVQEKTWKYRLNPTWKHESRP